MGQFLTESDLAEVDNQTRYRLFKVLDNFDAVETWRASLGEDRRLKLNHPNAVYWAWKAATRPSREPVASKITRKPAELHKNIFWPQDVIRRAAAAMRESRSPDYFILARLALEAAIRSESDIAEVLQQRQTKPIKRPAAAPVELAVPA